MDVSAPDARPAAQLWTARLDTLKGFYASHAHVVASTQAEAIETLLEGVRAYVAQQIAEYSTFLPLGCDPDDAEWDAQISDFYQRVTTEAQQHLMPVASGVVIHVHN